MSAAFRNSCWFSRGWTLLELLAPRTLVFLDADWKVLGSKSSLGDPGTVAISKSVRNLDHEISSITGIPERFLQGEELSKATIVERAGWARKRQTTEVEDMAYCLMGLFNVNMPLIYGKGVHAFKRLKTEIMKRWYDGSTPPFNWPSEFVGSSTARSSTQPSRSRRRRHRADLSSLEPPLGSEQGFELRQTSSASNNAEPFDQVNNLQHLSETTGTLETTSAILVESKVFSRWPTCWILLLFAILFIGGSLAVGLYYSVAEDRMGDGFTVAGWMTAVGTLILAVPITQHYPHCKCWTNGR